MAYTDHSDVYGALHEDGINRVVDHLMRKRPSLFNYGTPRVVAGAHARESERRSAPVPSLSHRAPRIRPVQPCEKIPYASEVREQPWNNPLMTEEDPLPVLGTDGLVGLDYSVQVTELELDFAPDDLDYGIEAQQYAAHVTVCSGLGCPTDETYDAALESVEEFRRYVANQEELSFASATEDEELLAEFGLPIVPRPEHLHCFCLDVSVIGGVEMIDNPTVEGPLTVPQSPRFTIDDITIADLESQEEFPLPAGLIGSIQCYIEAFVRLGLLPALAESIERSVQHVLQMQNPLMTLSNLNATVELPTSGNIPNNPAIKEDEFRLHIDLNVTASGGP